jgi:hypothetical protein
VTKKVFALDTKPGIQRDGTTFDKQYYSDGQWVRFQRGRPRKIGGYKQIVDDLAGPSRGIYVDPRSSFNDVYSGYNNGLQVIPIDNNGVGSGITFLTLNNFTPNNLNLWQFDTFTDTAGSGNKILLAHPGLNLLNIDNEVNTPVLGGAVSGTTMSAIGVFTRSATTTSGLPTITLSAANTNVGVGQLVTGVGIPASTTVTAVVGTTVTLSNNASASGTVTLTFDNQVEVSGGVVTLHPYVFVYGNNGLIRNSASGNIDDWVSAEANEVNVATGKFIQALPVRGGSNSPSGLFWSLDSLVRVSYAPTNIVVGATTVTQYWRYDIISSQSSIMSSQCVIEYDGIYYWIGTDRFLLYNGVVKEIPNAFNQNYFFDNLNYSQRQKVWATKVPRFGEIWWFYPRGDSTECNDAIIYNIRENCWYDAGTAVGSRRSAGFFSQVFRFPISAGWEPNAVGGVDLYTLTSPGSGYVNGTYSYVPVSGGAGTGATATVVVAGGVVTSFTIQDRGVNYAVGNTLTVANTHLGGTGSGLAVTVDATETYVSLWQHETGTDAIRGTTQLAVESYFTTNDLGWVSGGPSEPAMVGENRWLDIERVEPDFLLSGSMTMNFQANPYAQSDTETSSDYVFGADTNKIDVRFQGRELRIRFTSNEVGGNYQCGRILLNGYFGDVRGY